MESSRTTTSWPISTSRLARSIDSSATVVWSDGGRSKVEAMTSPFTERCMSVTSSGRSSTRTTMRWHSGLFLVIALAIACSTIVLPAFGGETIRPRWPLPIGLTRSMIRVVSWFDSAPGLLGLHAVDRVEADERVELLTPLALARLAHRAGDDVALAQTVLAD